jgi:hypothetical protein
MLNLFILVILDQFDQFYLPKDSPITLYKKDLEVFKAVWSGFKPSHSGLKLPDSKIVEFFGTIDPPLGMKGEPRMKVIRQILELELRR